MVLQLTLVTLEAGLHLEHSCTGVEEKAGKTALLRPSNLQPWGPEGDEAVCFQVV